MNKFVQHVWAKSQDGFKEAHESYKASRLAFDSSNPSVRRVQSKYNMDLMLITLWKPYLGKIFWYYND